MHPQPVCAAPAAYRIETESAAHFVCIRHQPQRFAELIRLGHAPTLHELPIGERRCGEHGRPAAALIAA